MTVFQSIYQRYEKESQDQPVERRPWPATYRAPLPSEKTLNHFTLQIRIEGQLPKSMSMQQLSLLPSFREARRITSKSGWTYYGQWKGITFQTLLNLFSTPQLYPWVRLETLNGEHCILERTALLNYRMLLECDGEPLSLLYGGPIWTHCFDYYLEYGIPHLQSIILMQGDCHYEHPAQALGYTLDQARVAPGQYFAIHHDKIAPL